MEGEHLSKISHLQYLFNNPTISGVVGEIRDRHLKKQPIILSQDSISEVREIYPLEMCKAEGRTHDLVEAVLGKYWNGMTVYTTMNIEALCPSKNHENPIILVQNLKREYIKGLKSSDENLTDRIVSENTQLQNCVPHNAQVKVSKSFLLYTPYEPISTSLKSRYLSFENVEHLLNGTPVITVTSRIKSPGDLVDKITDQVFELGNTRDRLHNHNFEIADLCGIRITAYNNNPERKKACFKILNFVTTLDDTGNPEIKDYINAPKENGYRALHVIIRYKGLHHEIQIVDIEMHQKNTTDPKIRHETYREIVNAQRLELGEPWFELNLKLRELFGLQQSYLKSSNYQPN